VTGGQPGRRAPWTRLTPARRLRSPGAHDGRPATAAAATPYGLLVECPHGLLGHGAGQVAAAAGKGNVPRARNFAGAGYPVTQERVNFV